MRSEHGQASVEWVAVVALVAVVLGVAVTTGGSAAAASVVNGVHRGMARALCLVTGDGCLATEVQACVVSRADQAYEVGIKALVVAATQRGAVVRSALSDGTIELTLLEGGSLGAELTAAAARIRLGGAEAGVELGGTASLLGDAERTRTWRLRDPAAAAALARALREHLLGDALAGRALPSRLLQHALDRGISVPLPPADATSRRGELRGTATAKGTVELGTVGEDELVLPGGEASAGGKGAIAVRRSVDRRTGRRTTSYELQGEVAAELRAVQQLQGGKDGVRLAISITAGADGRPLLVSTTDRGPDALPADAPRPRGGDEVEVTRSLDLTGDPAAATTTAALEAALRGARPRDAVRATRELRAHLVRGQVDVRTYATSRKAPVDVAATLGLGVGAGASAKVTRSSGRLRGAWARPAGGVWERRSDCDVAPLAT